MINIILKNIVFILFALCLYKKIKHGLHMYQLESYFFSRYMKWIKNNFKNIIKIPQVIMLIIPIVLLFAGKETIALILLIITYGMIIINTNTKKEKKPFVVTARIKRMYFVQTLILIGILALINISQTSYIGITIMSIVTIFSYFLVFVIATITSPIEAYIKHSFCIKATTKLKSMKDLKIIGITGSYGKTSTKYIVNTILSQKYNSLMTPESYNTTMGVVRTINERLESIHNMFVCEMGAKNIGDIKEICDIVHPQYAILTAIGPQHLETFKNIDNVRKTKLELIDSLPDDGIAFINWEDENIRKAKIEKRVIKFGLDKNSDYYAQNIEITEKGSSFDIALKNKNIIKIKTKLLGKLNILNIVGAIAVADTLGLSEEEIKIGVKFVKPVPHRLEMKQNPDGSIIIDDAYNSNIKGAKMALEALSEFKDRKKIVITPGIVDLGEKTLEINKELGRNIAKSSDYVILVGEMQARPILEGIKQEKYDEKNIYVAKNLEDAISKMKTVMNAKSVILLENDLPDNYL